MPKLPGFPTQGPLINISCICGALMWPTFFQLTRHVMCCVAPRNRNALIDNGSTVHGVRGCRDG